MNSDKEIIEDFVSEGENFLFGVINDELKVYSLENIVKIINDIGIKKVENTYFEQIIFEGNDGELYELGYL